MSTVKIINGKMSAKDKNGMLSGAAVGLKVAQVVEDNKSEAGKVKSGFYCMGYVCKLVTLHTTTLEPRAKGQNFVMLEELSDLPKLQLITKKGSDTVEHPMTYATMTEFLKVHNIDKWTPRAKAAKAAKAETKLNVVW